MTNLEITNAYVGSDQISKLYLGGEAIWPLTPPEPVYSAMPLTFEIISGGTIVWYNSGSNPKEIEYSKDNGVTWTSITSSTATSITVETGDKVQFRGYNDTYGGSSDSMCSSFIGSTTGIESTAVFEVYGNIMSLVDGDNYEGLQFTTANTNCFRGLFNHFGITTSQSLISAEHLILPDNTVENCYRSMFTRCVGLVEAPELPATTLAKECYKFMFDGCTGLTTAPSLLPATTLASNCYQQMFRGCSSLTSAPALPATTLADRCYYEMFRDCASLTTAPELPATTLTSNCYSYMFGGCTNLNYIKCLATSITGTTSWVQGVASSGTFVKDANATWSTGTSGIPDGWTVIDA